MPNYNPYQTQQQVRLPYADPTLLKGRPVTSIEEVRAANRTNKQKVIAYVNQERKMVIFTFLLLGK